MKAKIMILTLCMLFTYTNFSNGILIHNLTPVSKEITYSNLYQEIILNSVKFPEVVFAQALLESGNFTSNVFKTENNLFGMKYPRRRITTALEKGETGYANYIHWTKSVIDYKLWQQQNLKNKNIQTQTEYLNYLSRVYAEDKNYIRKLKSFIPRS